MKLLFSKTHLKRICLPIMLGVVGSAQASELDKINAVSGQKVDAAIQSQAKIDKVVDEAQKRLITYRALMKQIEGLEAYNEQLDSQVKSQAELIERFDGSIQQVALIERQMSPLVSKMAEALEEFYNLDVPFHVAERQERLAFIQDNLASADINVAEKFRQVIEAYQIESEYGRKIDSYNDVVVIDGNEYEVDVLRVGRIALVCQTKDSKLSAVWNQQGKVWESLDNNTYRNAIRKGIKMAKKQESINLMTLPIAAAVEVSAEGEAK